MKKAILSMFIIFSLLSYSQENKLNKGYLEVLEEKGQEPVKFVNDLLESVDLLIFDDALHLAKEPFDFYQELIRNDQFKSKVKYIFIEVFSTTSQPYIDEYFSNSIKDNMILLSVFQNDYSGYGWRYKTYLDLLETIWEENSQLSESDKIQVICVNQPIYWSAIQTRKDYEFFQESLVGRDYFMYKIILQTLEDFKIGAKGIFLTNTRHAYKGVKKSSGKFYWNTGTFLNQWHPKKTYSIRLHNVNLSIQSKLDNSTFKSTEGLDRVSYKWVRIDNGRWDNAFKENGNVPIAIPLEKNVFGKTPYTGNHMLNVAHDQTMYDAYDGLIFLAPLEELHFSGKVDFIYTNSFIQELKRRLSLLHGNQLSDFLSKHGVDTLDDFIKKTIKPQEPMKNTLVPKKRN
ncbi:hypothetical protein ATE84_2980 [Aquimarina sp. MAR_2010_214]|uniref:hypothetical protein n=1 Tax=Aquimarina sp. MAR_2010_214 TaxID=1250026 RepID=UPI000C6FE143|nr:hypothetical protein [Aquimarina sp. MAR_2010_214]PKV50911.1 hypothetical protein ATE84_2980 [Aquimarina sp. MAR_2010_214]